MSTEQKAELLRVREANEKAELARKFAASRENYRGIATAKQVKQQIDKIERFLKDPQRLNEALAMKGKS